MSWSWGPWAQSSAKEDLQPGQQSVLVTWKLGDQPIGFGVPLENFGLQISLLIFG